MRELDARAQALVAMNLIPLIPLMSKNKIHTAIHKLTPYLTLAPLG